MPTSFAIFCHPVVGLAARTAVHWVCVLARVLLSTALLHFVMTHMPQVRAQVRAVDVPYSFMSSVAVLSHRVKHVRQTKLCPVSGPVTTLNGPSGHIYVSVWRNTGTTMCEVKSASSPTDTA
jgi:hypothetical protein